MRKKALAQVTTILFLILIIYPISGTCKGTSTRFIVLGIDDLHGFEIVEWQPSSYGGDLNVVTTFISDLGGISQPSLSVIDVLVVNGLERGYMYEELEAIKEWVKTEGGIIVIIYDKRSDLDKLNELAGVFGGLFTSNVSKGWIEVESNISTMEKVFLDEGRYIEPSTGSINPLLKSIQNSRFLVAESRYGNGLVVLFSTFELLDFSGPNKSFTQDFYNYIRNKIHVQSEEGSLEIEYYLNDRPLTSYPVSVTVFGSGSYSFYLFTDNRGSLSINSKFYVAKLKLEPRVENFFQTYIGTRDIWIRNPGRPVKLQVFQKGMFHIARIQFIVEGKENLPSVQKVSLNLDGRNVETTIKYYGYVLSGSMYLRVLDIYSSEKPHEAEAILKVFLEKTAFSIKFSYVDIPVFKVIPLEKAYRNVTLRIEGYENGYLLVKYKQTDLGYLYVSSTSGNIVKLPVFTENSPNLIISVINVDKSSRITRAFSSLETALITFNETTTAKLSPYGLLVLVLSNKYIWGTTLSDLENRQTIYLRHLRRRTFPISSTRSLVISLTPPGTYSITIENILGRRITISNGTEGYVVSPGKITFVDAVSEGIKIFLREIYSRLEYVSNLVNSAISEGYIPAETENDIKLINEHINLLKEAYSEGKIYATETEIKFILDKLDALEGYLYIYSKLVAYSSFVLFFFMIFFSYALAKMIAEKSGLHALALAFTIFMLSQILLYFVHPGYKDFLSIGENLFYYKLTLYISLYFALFILFFWEIPNNLSRAPTPEKPHFWGAVSMAFHLAINDLRKRRLRTILLLTTITITVMSFVAFTSVSSKETIVSSLMFKQTAVKKILVGVSQNVGTQDIARISELLDKPLEEILVRVKTMWQEDFLYSIGSNSEKRVTLEGILFIDPTIEKEVTMLDDSILVKGDYIEATGDILLSKTLAEALEVKPGDYIKLYSPFGSFIMNLKIKGIFDEEKLGSIKDVDGDTILPKIYIREEESGAYRTETADSRYVAIMHVNNRYSVSSRITGVYAIEKDADEAYSNARKLLLYYKAVVYASNGMSKTLTKGTSISLIGTSALVPIIIGILICMNSMTATVYEKRKDIWIYSSLGLSPSQIEYLFTAQALVLALVGGGLGYSLGAGLLVVGGRLGVFQELYYRLSPLWTVLGLMLATLVTTLATILPARKATLRVVPSKVTRWTLGKRQKELEEELPFRIEEHQVENFLKFVKKRILAIFPPYSVLTRSSVEITKYKERYVLTIHVQNVSEQPNELKAIIEVEPILNTRLYKVHLKLKPIRIRMGYRELAETVIREIRRIILLWQAIYKKGGK